MILLDLLKIMGDTERITIYLNDGYGNHTAEYVGLLGGLRLPPIRYADQVLRIRRERDMIEIEVMRGD